MEPLFNLVPGRHLHLKKLAGLGFLTFRAAGTESAATTGLMLGVLLFTNGHDDGLIKDFFNADAFLGAALHVHGAHLGCNGTTLFRRHWGQALCLKQVNASLLMSQIRL